MFASSSAYFFGEIIITPKNVPDIICLIVSIFSAKSIFNIITIFFVRRIPSCFPSLLYLQIQSILSIGCFIGCADPSFFLNIISNIFLAKFSSDRIINLTLNFFYLKSNIIFIFLKLVFTNSIFIRMFFYIPVITRAFLLITPYIIFVTSFDYSIRSPRRIISSYILPPRRSFE